MNITCKKQFLCIAVLFVTFFIGTFSTAFADAPEATNLSAAESYTEDTSLNLIDIVVSDADEDSLTVTLTLSNIAAGSLSTGTSGAVTSTYNAGTGVWTVAGAIADVNILLAGVVFTPTGNFNSNFTIATSVTDGIEAALTGTKAVTGVAVNDPPTATNLSAAEVYTEDTALNLTDIVASDVDSATVTATLTLSTTAAGTLSTATSGAVTSVFSSGIWTASGAISSVNTLLAGVTFVPAADYNSSFAIVTSVTDGVAPAVTGTKIFTGVSVNDAPVLDSTRSPALSSIDEDAGVPVGAVGTLVSSLVDFASPVGQVDNVTDVDSGASLGIAITAVSTTNLTWYYSLNSGSSWIPLGAVSGVSSLLLAANGSSRIYAQPSASFSGTVSSALTFRAWDQTSGVDGATADTSTSGGTTAFSTATDTVNLTVNAVNAAPVANDDDYDDGGVVLEDDVDIALSVLDNDTDGDDDDLTIVSVTEPSHGSAEISGDTVLYTPEPDYCGFDAFDYSIEDTSFEGDTATVYIFINCVNDSPEATNLSTPESYGENFPYDLTDIVMSDVDTTDMIVTLTLSDTIYGTLSTGTSGAVTSTYDGDTGVWAATGDIEDVNILLADLNFVPFENIVGDFTIEISIKDDELAIPLTGTKVMTGIPWDNHAPELDATKSPVLEAIDENAGTPSGAVGTLVSSLVDFASPSGQMDNVTDFDDGALLGIAITAVDSELSCYSSLDDGGLWVEISIDPDTSLLLAADADNRVYCDPGSDQYGTYSEVLTFRAWDQTEGADGGVGDNIIAGGSTATSDDTDTISLTVNDVPESSSGGGGGSTHYSCRDVKASNYSRFGASKSSLCKYTNVTPAVASSTPASILGSGTCSANLMITAFLKEGSRGDQVRILQAHINRILAAQYSEAAGPVDGIFGPLTKQGVIRLQTVLRDVLGLDLGPAGADGIVGPFTGGAANNSCGGM